MDEEHEKSVEQRLPPAGSDTSAIVALARPSAEMFTPWGIRWERHDAGAPLRGCAGWVLRD
eukprot:gene28592-53015_t